MGSRGPVTVIETCQRLRRLFCCLILATSGNVEEHRLLCRLRTAFDPTHGTTAARLGPSRKRYMNAIPAHTQSRFRFPLPCQPSHDDERQSQTPPPHSCNKLRYTHITQGIPAFSPLLGHVRPASRHDARSPNSASQLSMS
ncbi:hypothetical protein VTH06DRAFT_4240 [Thermothelomyces fergusii]